jgi:hypothetical protein
MGGDLRGAQGRRKDLICRRLAEEGEAALAFFRKLEEVQWERQVYSEGSCWTIRQVLCHFVSAEDALLRLAGNILDGGAGAPAGFEIDDFNEREVGGMADRPLADLLAEFARLRAETAALVARIDEADLDREGRHPFFGRSSLEKLFKLVYRHNMIHLRDVRRVLGDSR